jgi:periplasmic protein CpxP/Spy
MNRTKLLTIVIIGLLIMNLGILCILFLNRGHNDHPAGMPPRGEGPKKIIIERLHFDPSQVNAYESLIEVHKKRTHELNDTSKILHRNLYALLNTSNPDTAKANELIRLIAEKQKEVDHLNFDHFSDIKKLCKPEQMDDFNLLTEDLAELFGHKGPPPPDHK